MKVGSFPQSCCDRHRQKTHLGTFLHPCQDSDLSSVTLLFAWNKVMFGQERTLLRSTCLRFFLLISVGFRLYTAVVLSQLLVKSNYIFNSPYLQVCVLIEGDLFWREAKRHTGSVFSKYYCVSQRLGLWEKQNTTGLEGSDRFIPRSLFSSGCLCKLAVWALWSMTCCQLELIHCPSWGGRGWVRFSAVQSRAVGIPGHFPRTQKACSLETSMLCPNETERDTFMFGKPASWVLQGQGRLGVFRKQRTGLSLVLLLWRTTVWVSLKDNHSSVNEFELFWWRILLLRVSASLRQ